MTEDKKKPFPGIKTVLLVDDEAVVREIGGEMLENLGFSLIIAENAEEGLKLYREKKPDLVITDIEMPGMDGVKFIKILRSENETLPIIVISGYAHNYLVAKYGLSEAKVDVFMSKPFQLDKLQRMLEKDLKLNWSQRLNLNDYYRRYIKELVDENKRLRELRETDSKNRKRISVEKEVESFKSLWASIAHGLKSEFMNIGYSIKEIQSDSNISQEVIEETNIIERSLAYSKIMMQRLFNYLDVGAPQKDPIELSVLFTKLEDLAKPRLPSNIQWKILLPPGLAKTKILVNDDQLIGVLMEFIQNASNALRHKGGNINVLLEKKNSDISISVRDDGPGIPKDIKKKLFKEQIPSKSGLGLGLYLSNKVINQFGGPIRFNSSAGKGTTFTITFPIVEEKKEL